MRLLRGGAKGVGSIAIIFGFVGLISLLFAAPLLTQSMSAQWGVLGALVGIATIGVFVYACLAAFVDGATRKPED